MINSRFKYFLHRLEETPKKIDVIEVTTNEFPAEEKNDTVVVKRAKKPAKTASKTTKKSSKRSRSPKLKETPEK